MQSLPIAVRAAVFCFGLVLFASSSRADTVYLKNGAYIDGLVTARSQTLLTISIGQIGKLEVSMEDVVRVEKNSRTGSHVLVPVDRRELPDVVRKKNESTGDADDPEGGDVDGEGDDEDGGEDEDGDEDGDEEEDGDGDEIDPKLKAEIEKHIADLQRQKTKHRRRAERRLEKIGAPAVPFLLPLVTRGGDLTRITALRLVAAHAKVRDPEVVEVCLKALLDANYFVRDYGVKTLRRLTDQDFDFDAKAGARSRGRALSKWQRWWEKEKEKAKEADDDGAEADEDEDNRDRDDGDKKKKRRKKRASKSEDDDDDDEEEEEEDDVDDDDDDE